MCFLNILYVVASLIMNLNCVLYVKIDSNDLIFLFNSTVI